MDLTATRARLNQNGHDKYHQIKVKIKAGVFNRTKENICNQYTDLPHQVVWNEVHETKKTTSDFGTSEWLRERFTAAHLGIEATKTLSNSRSVRLPIVIFISFIITFFLLNAFTSAINLFPHLYASSYEKLIPVALTIFCITLLFAAAGFIRPIFSSFIMPKILLTQAQIDDVEQLINRTILRIFDSAKTPEDLQDNYRNLVVDADGRPVDGQLIMLDIEEPFFYKEYIKHIGFYYVSIAASACLAFSFFHFEKINFDSVEYVIISSTSATILFITLICNYIFRSRIFMRQRVANLSTAVSSTLTLIDKVGSEYFKSIESARKTQIENAFNDKSKFLELGKTTGRLFERRDPFAPCQSDMPFGLSFNDLSTHLMVMGNTGEGKTSGVIRPIAKCWLDSNAGGLFVLDGKGTLPGELQAASANYQLIHPNFAEINPIENLSADEIADSFYEMNAAVDSADPVWDKSATKLIRSSAVLMYLTDLPKTLQTLYKIVSDDEFLIESVCPQMPPSVEMSAYELNAANHRISEFIRLPERTKASILNNATLWISAITDHQKLSSWATCESGVLIENVCSGASIGLNLPESEFGQAGIVVAAMSKKRLYKAIRNRGDNWRNVDGQKPVLLLIDEVQGLLTADESAMLPIARSLGLYCTFSTQNIDGIDNALKGKEKTEQLLGNLKSMIALKMMTQRSNEYVAHRFGCVWRTTIESCSGTVDTMYEVNAMRHNAADYINRNNHLSRTEKQISSAIPRSKTSKFARKIEPFDTDHFASSDSTAVIKNMQIVDANEIDAILSEPNTALAQVIRGRILRRDVIRLTPIYN